MIRYALIVAPLALAAPAHAGETPLYAPAPAWVKPAMLLPEPSSVAGEDEPPVRLLLTDQQVAFEPGLVTAYSEIVMKIGTPQGLAAGNISLPWKPDTDTLTIHRLTIRRGDKVTDVLAAGQTFTVVRRETNLENATLDGVLTANIQPEGLQVGDVIELSMSIASRDPMMKRNAEFVGASWNGTPIGRARFRARWPVAMPIRLRTVQSLPAVKPVRSGDFMTIDLAVDKVVPLVLPKGAPPRFQIGRMLELSTFATWADVAGLMAPLYAQTAVLPTQGPLLAEVERIRTASSNPKVRAQAALALVQDRIRYVALAMGTGGLVPADTTTTWSRRFGDCKGKTVLLIAILHSLGIAADPVAVSSGFGDGMDTRLPRVGAFDHVLVRSTIEGKTYWLDGTRTGDVSLDRLTVPAFGWGLPLAPRGAALVRMMPTPLEQPTADLSIQIDATAGLMVPAPVKVESVLRGDAALAFGAALANLAGDARDRALREYWKGQYDFIDVASVSTGFDPKTGERRLSMQGKARMDWSSGWYEADGMGIGYRADFAREPGPDRDAPFAVTYPYYLRTVETIRLPAGFPNMKTEGRNDIDQTVAGIEYRRRVKLSDGLFTAEKTERSIVPEFAAKDAPAAQAVLRDLADQTLYIRRPSTYNITDAELAVWQAKTLTSDGAYVERGTVLLDRRRYDEAIKDFDAALAIEPSNVFALADRGIAKVWKQDFNGADRDLAAAEKLDPRNAVLWRARGLMAQMKFEPKVAQAAFSRSIEIDPGNSFALSARAHANRALGDNDAALADTAAAIAISPKWTDLYLLRANIFRQEGKPEAVAAEARAVALANPDDAYAHVVAGSIYRALGRRDDALDEFDRALMIQPADYIYVNRMQSRARTDRAGRMADIAAALKLDPKSLIALSAKASLLIDDDNFADAISTYDAALALAPSDEGLLTSRGLAKLRAGRAADGERDLKAASTLSKQADQFNNMCWAKATAGLALESALADCNQALAKLPKTPAFLDSKGLVLLRLKRLDDAIAAYDDALAASPTKAGSLYGRGVAWARKGDKARADADLAAAMKINAQVKEEFADYGVAP